jgi:hypothetical protein
MADEPNIHEPDVGESAIPGHLASLDTVTTMEGGPHESSPPRRSAEDERRFDEVGRLPEFPGTALTDEELAERDAKAAKKAKE